MFGSERAIAEAYYYYELYKKDAIAKGEKPLTMFQLLFGRK